LAEVYQLGLEAFEVILPDVPRVTMSTTIGAADEEVV